jgi:hypothetical protein
MFGTFFSLLVFLALLGICGEITMRVRLSRRETTGEKLAWWRCGGDAVSAAYDELFPNSRITAYRRFIFWLVLFCAASALVTILWKSV